MYKVTITQEEPWEYTTSSGLETRMRDITVFEQKFAGLSIPNTVIFLNEMAKELEKLQNEQHRTDK